MSGAYATFENISDKSIKAIPPIPCPELGERKGKPGASSIIHEYESPEVEGFDDTGEDYVSQLQVQPIHIPDGSTEPLSKASLSAERPRVQFWAPPGWDTELTKDREWAVFQSPKKDGALLFTTYIESGEATTRLGKALEALKVTNVTWDPVRSAMKIGLDKFDASFGGGSSTYQGGPGFVWFATIDTKVDRERMLVVFAVTQGSATERRAEAQAFLDSLQRRR